MKCRRPIQLQPIEVIRRFDFEQVNGIAVEVPYPVLREHAQVLTLEPVAGEQHAIGIAEELLLVVGQGPAASGSQVRHRRLPAPGTHQAATSRPRARTLAVATSNAWG